MEQEILNLGIAGVGLVILAKSYREKDIKLEQVTHENRQHTEELILRLEEKHDRETKEKMNYYNQIINNIQNTFTNTLSAIREDSKQVNTEFRETLDNLNISIHELKNVIDNNNKEIEQMNNRLEKLEKKEL